MDVEGNKGDTFAVTGTGCVFVGDALYYSVVTAISLGNKALTTNFTATLLGKFVNLYILILSNNQVTAISLNGLVNLNLLYLQGNQITDIDLSGLINLRDINLSNNRLNVLKNYEILTELAANGVNNGVFETTNYGKLQAANALQFVAGTNVTFPNYTINGNFTATIVVEILHTVNNQVLLKDSATDFGLYKRSSTGGNYLAIRFNPLVEEIHTSQELEEGWHKIQWSYNADTFEHTITVDDEQQFFMFSNINNINGRIINSVTASANQFTGKVAELSISNFAHWKFVEETGYRVYDTLNSNDALIRGTINWTLANNTYALNYPNLEGYSVKRKGLQFTSNTVVDFPHFTINQSFKVNLIVEIFNTVQNQVLIKNNNANNLGLFKRRVGLDNRLAINFLGTDLVSSLIPSQGSHFIEWEYDYNTFEHTLKVDGVVGTWFTNAGVPTNNVLNINSGVMTKISATPHSFSGILIEFEIEGFLYYKLTEGTGTVLNSANSTNNGAITGTFTWIDTNGVLTVFPKKGASTDVFGNPLEFAAGALPYPDATIIADGEAAKTALLSDGWTVAIGETI